MLDAVLTDRQVAAAIQEIAPSRVAVAYLGVNWKKYLPDLARLQDVVVAPVLGTSPRAVLALKKEMRALHGGSGWEHLHFLDTLHAKLYLGERGAVFGSANLSDRGLAGGILEELCHSTQGAGELVRLRSFFDQVLAKARRQYPSEADKMRRLEKLQEDTRKNPAFSQQRGPATPFSDFELLAPDQFYVAWYEPATHIGYGGDAADLQSTIDEYRTLCLRPRDNVAEYKWVLCWDRTSLRNVTPLHWLFIDGIARRGVEYVDGLKTSYTKLAYQRVPQKSLGRASDQPFKLDASIGRAFKACLEANKSLARQMQSDRLDTSQKVLPELIAALRANLGLPPM